MAKVPTGSETYPKLFKPRSIGDFTLPAFVIHAARSVSNVNEMDKVGEIVLPQDARNAIHEGF